MACHSYTNLLTPPRGTLGNFACVFLAVLHVSSMDCDIYSNSPQYRVKVCGCCCDNCEGWVTFILQMVANRVKVLCHSADPEGYVAAEVVVVR